ncbi:hypothetical protein LLG95_10975 [bacterium]|nr:hypothetical protein [bacterium]
MTLVAQVSDPVGDILGVQLLLGGGAVSASQWEPLRRMQARFQSPEALRLALERKRADGFRSVLALGEPRLLEALGRKHTDEMPLPLPLVPNLRGFMREAVEYGMVGAGVRRVWRGGVMSLVGLSLRGLTQLGPLKKKDFPTYLRMFIDLELAAFSRHDPPLVFLQPQMTDLAVAMNNPRIIEGFQAAVGDRTAAQIGLATANFGRLTSALKTWGIEVAAVIAPWDEGGSGMRPNVDACIRAAKACDFPIWADRLGHLEPPQPEDREMIRQAGLAGMVRDDFALWADV